MTTPLQVLKAAEEAEKLYREIYKTPNDTSESKPASNEPADKTDDEIVVKESSDSKPDDTTPAKDEKEPEQHEPKQEDWKHKYEVLQGMYNKDIQDLRQKFDLALKRIDELTIRPVADTKDTSMPAKAGQDILAELESDPEVQYIKGMYPDVWKAMSKVTERVAKLTKEEVEKVSSKVKEQSDIIVRSERDKFYDKLDASVKDWEQIQSTPEFREWLSGVERYTGKTRGELLRNAYERLDAVSAAAFFEDFMKEAKPIASKNDTPVPTKDKVVVEPRSAGTRKPSVAKPDATEQPKLTVHEVQKFYDDVQRGKYQGREKERREMESKIEKALVEGRII